LPYPLEEDAAGYLYTLGALGCRVVPNGTHAIEMEAVFPEEGSAATGARALEGFLRRLGCSSPVRRVERPDEPWVERYEASRDPLALPGGFLVLPRDSRGSDRSVTRTLVIPPGRAFGTGEHPTTRLTLAAMVRELRPGRPVLDLGTGSGLLAFAAARLGAAPVVGIDHDPDAVAVARANRRLNGLDGAVRLLVGTTASLARRPFDLVAANLYLEVLEEVSRPLARRQVVGGRCVLSGFSPDQVPRLRAAWEESGYGLRRSEVEGDWAAVTLVREGPP
jgi:ribosomal protein L11 methyltransferase